MDKKSTPKVIKGVPQPPSINLQAVKRFNQRRQMPDTHTLVQGILAGDRVRLSQAITLVESTKPAHQTQAQAVINACLPHAGRAFRLGLTGSPGVGKSTFVEAFGQFLIQEAEKKVAVLAIDPSSQLSKGSILGDKTRMQRLAVAERAFIRPSAAGSSLGGVARKTRETIILCEAAGYDFIVVETVGVGQSEIAVHSMVDFFMLLLLPGGGDELQGIKKGIVEMADLVAINKADGHNEHPAKLSKRAYSNALHILPPKRSGWTPQAITCSGLSGLGLADSWALMQDFEAHTRANGYWARHRQDQARYWMHETIQEELKRRFFESEAVAAQLSTIEAQVVAGQLSPFAGAEQLLQLSR